MDSRRLSIALIITAVALSGEANEIEVQANRSVWVGVEVDHNSSDEWCEAPGQPLNGGYTSETDGNRYSPGDTITYHCNRRHELIGQANRTCNGTPNGWHPHEPYCQPEYIGHLMRRLSGIEDRVRAIGQRITTIENNTSQIGNKISVMDNRMATIENHVTATDKGAAVNNGSAIYNTELYDSQIDRQRLEACTDINKTIDQDTLTKCKTMQIGVRNGRSVSVYTWVIGNYNSWVPQSLWDSLYSQPFYHTVPGYKFRLRAVIFKDSGIYISIQLLPGEYDDQLKWPFSQMHDVTVLTNTGLEVTHRTFSGRRSECYLNRPTSPTDLGCYTLAPNWDDVYQNKTHILSDGSVVVKLYFYN